MTVRELIAKLSALPPEQLDWEVEVSTDCESEGAHFADARDVWVTDRCSDSVVIVDASEEI